MGYFKTNEPCFCAEPRISEPLSSTARGSGLRGCYRRTSGQHSAARRPAAPPAGPLGPGRASPATRRPLGLAPPARPRPALTHSAVVPAGSGGILRGPGPGGRRCRLQSSRPRRHEQGAAQGSTAAARAHSAVRRCSSSAPRAAAPPGPAPRIPGSARRGPHRPPGPAPRHAPAAPRHHVSVRAARGGAKTGSSGEGVAHERPAP